MKTQKDKSNLIVLFGFGVVIVLMIVLMITGLHLLRNSNNSLNTIVNINNQKVEYATAMREAIRLRQISLNSMLALTDFEELDNELMRFYNLARPYREAREKLLAMPNNEYEHKLHDQLTRQVRISQPSTRDAADALTAGTPIEETIPIVKYADDEQNKLLSLLDKLVMLQKEYATKAVTHENNVYTQSRRYTIIIGLLLIIGTIAIAIYISGQVLKRNQKLVDAYQKADEATRAKTRFLSQMSHELRTPMNAILGFSELMHGDENLTNDQKVFIEDILNAGNHLLALINQVLDLARIENNKVNLDMESVSLGNLLQDCRIVSIPLAKTQDVTLYMGDITCNDKFVYADKLRLKQIFINLISNAIKYNNKGGLVTIKCEIAENDKYHISITDTGPGIPESKMNELFQPFSRLGAEHTKTEGTGIGLVITKNLVELMGGSIGVKNAEDGGSVFWIELQRGQLNSTQDEITHEEESKSQYMVITDDKKTLLYIEDDIENTRVMKHFISRIGNLRLINAATAERGILMAQSYHPDLILMDIKLPGMDGFEALGVLQNMGQTKDVPVVAVSANVMPGDIKSGMDAGFNDYITKPIDFEKLKKTLKLYCKASKHPLQKVV